jgi:hypothetical protein
VFVALVAAAVLTFIFLRARRDNVTADNVIAEPAVPAEPALAAAA